ncbi:MULTISPECIES: Asp-tRNA(Asn)/Glu-tRNA(Gln) amidotransferase subunit GatB [Desulfovibrio]|uniref:Aspartyl/glutamyl-tRNA(Asn/Gln) amidotransferase subunit B n=2 Tax=root TaxID=1 RepID=A0A212KL98_9BACT|nr:MULTISPECIES: Asp-tRNA(Asn)/Glu-tRNA(Gln) amidotransferase subunit GatB [Desulfovibrio]MBT9748986.1 Asp-tRNA(Asn)/Glu-tRNA(Gln) amidotransferase subunit GatB [Desulfovibrio desulfuricans]MCB6541790.1 Asp-tRNA(Asn)/Glu-tRNA(Gln) amidotransferase subunit GatB [Desulfovibrio desulfuricans]MCB6552944.1 Asp-tRNA(Asn)/Glu-tRNA(Gln) amidotransferase subunit GatB [Desulfovibrio desulfuricans]MCB6564788.1 Asp-tRNA(Asn)/Glu-tRNA(Gln) amidotransferase subunit GatB [Desulfovibrio desulfuricans]MCB73458
MAAYEAVIGLEVHVQLATASKLFCSCPTTFGQPANANVCEVCSGMPGALPVPNRQAVHFAALVGLATNCAINTRSIFARKNYFYPDLPSGYQISQFELPICEHGHLEVDVDGRRKRVGITRIHMENDAGKNIHAQGENLSYVDLNRAGTPLVEIVSEPDMRSAAEAVAYLKALYNIVTYLGVCDGNMEEGSFRCDANVSLRPVGTEPFGTRTELKNLNSFRNVQRAIEYEIARQQDVLDDGDKVVQETRLYDAVKNTTASMRSKEEAHDYRYFPDPDILPVDITEEEMTRWRAEMPELPHVRMARFVAMAGLPEAEAEVLVQSRGLADFFEAAAAKADPKKVANFVLGPLLRECNARGLSAADPSAWAMKPEALAELVRLVDGGTISAKIANDIFGDIFEQGVMPEAYVKEKGLVQISDTSALEAAVDEVIAANPAEVEAYRGGKTKLISFFVGQIMRATKGKANPALVNELLAKKL